MYYIPTEAVPEVRVKGLLPEMKSLMTEIYRRFGCGEFTLAQIAKGYEKKRVMRLIKRGMICMERKSNTYVYKLLVTPETHPECFGTTVLVSSEHTAHDNAQHPKEVNEMNKVILRAITIADVDDLLMIVGNPDVTRFIPHQPSVFDSEGSHGPGDWPSPPARSG